MGAPLPWCTSCQKNNKRGKLLKCLHTVCVGCLEKHLTVHNEVRCPKCGELTPSPSAGKTQLLFLPDSYAYCSQTTNDEESELRQEQALFCDDCCEEQKAISKCLDCSANLCDDHGRTHPRNRATFQHRVENIPSEAIVGTASGAGTAQVKQRVAKVCISHTSHKVQTFCMECRELLCDLCVHGGHDKTHSLVAVEEAAGVMRQRVTALLACRRMSNSSNASSSSSSSAKSVSQAVEKVEAALQDLRHQTDKVCEEVKAYFGELVTCAQSREVELLDILGGLRANKLRPLEKQSQRLRRCHVGHERDGIVRSLLDNCTNVYDFVRMAGWLEEAVTRDNPAASEPDLEPCVASNLAFLREGERDLGEAIANAGLVLDTAEPSSSSKCVGSTQHRPKATLDKQRSRPVLRATRSGPIGAPH